MVKRQWFMGIMDEDRIFVRQDSYDPDINRVLKAELPGPAKWERDYKVFTFPMHWDTCVNARKVANKFDAEIKIAPELNVWAANEKLRRESIPDVQSMALTELPRVQQNHDPLWKAISSRPFQSVGAAFAARNGSCLIADQPGLGKTLQSIAAVIESGLKGPILVVAPKAAAKLVWPQELAKWVPGDHIHIIGSHLPPTERARIALGAHNASIKRHWFITSPNYVRIKAEVDEYNHFVKGPDGKKKLKAVGEAVMELFDVEWSAVIVDESHQTLAGASGDIKKQSAQRVGLGALSVKPGGLRLALSGTPFRGKEEYLWGQLNWLRPDLYRSRWRWIKEWFDVYQDRYGMVIGHMTDRQGMYNQASTVMIRRTKEEVAKDLPAKVYNDIWLDMEGKQLKAYQDMERLAQADLEGGILQTTAMLAELTRLKQFAGSAGKMVDGHFTPTLPSNKFDWLVEWLDERGIAKDLDASAPKVVVASQFSQLIDCFAEGLKEQGILTHKFTGSTSDKDRERIKDDFQNNPDSKVRVLLLTTTAGGVALTLDAADELVVLDETWNTSDQEQLEDRLHRLSRMHQVTIWNVRSSNTIEESIAKKNSEAEFNIKSILDGARGVELVKELFKK
jgi:SNF2 family DNA or RNA helicase